MLYRDYLESIETMLGRMTINQCRDLFRQMALTQEPADRETFLCLIRDAGDGKKRKLRDTSPKGIARRSKDLMKEIRSFCERAEEGEFLGEDSYDDEWEDEWPPRASATADWQEEVISLLIEATTLARDGFPSEAEEAFSALIPVLAGNDVDSGFETELTATLEDAVPVHLHAIIASHVPEVACPKFQKGMLVARELIGERNCKLDAIRGANQLELEKWEQFVAAWVTYLSEYHDMFSRKLYLDARLQRDGLEGMLALARSARNEQPDVWLCALQEMIRQKETNGHIGEFCLELLQCHGLPTQEPVWMDSLKSADRRLVAATRVLIDCSTDHPGWMSVGLQARAELEPIATNLADWLHFMWKHEKADGYDWKRTAGNFLQHPALIDKSIAVSMGFSEEQRYKSRMLLLMLVETPLKRQPTADRCVPYGWSEGNETSFHHAWSLFFLLRGRLKDVPDKNMPDKDMLDKDMLDKDMLAKYPQVAFLWQNVLQNLAKRPLDVFWLEDGPERVFDGLTHRQESENSRGERITRMEELLRLAMMDMIIDETGYSSMEEWCRKTTMDRVKYILDHKHRRAYERASIAVVACAGMLTARHGLEIGKDFLENAKKPYVRFNAYTRTLRLEMASAPWLKS